MRKEKFKSENNNDKSYTHTHKKVCGEQDKSNETSFTQTHKHEKSAVSVVQERIC